LKWVILYLGVVVWDLASRKRRNAYVQDMRLHQRETHEEETEEVATLAAPVP